LNSVQKHGEQAGRGGGWARKAVAFLFLKWRPSCHQKYLTICVTQKAKMCKKVTFPSQKQNRNVLSLASMKAVEENEHSAKKELCKGIIF